MTTDITVLDSEETKTALSGHRLGKTNALLTQIADGLTKVVDTDGSVWVIGMTEAIINSLRTRMYRRNIQITVRRVLREGVRGHVITARTIQPEEQG